jgi:hypothetical protein
MIPLKYLSDIYYRYFIIDTLLLRKNAAPIIGHEARCAGAT